MTNPAAVPPPPAFFGGLDLGQMQDYTALSVLERTERDEGGRRVRRYAVRHLKRWPLRTTYPVIVADVVKMYAKAPLKGSVLTVDRTGVGVAVYDMLRVARPAARLAPITITGGAQAALAEDGCWSVPKRELAGILQVLLGTRRLEVAGGLELARHLAREMSAFKAKINVATGSESFEAWREKDHDDLVLAVAMPAWYAEKAVIEFGPPEKPGRSIADEGIDAGVFPRDREDDDDPEYRDYREYQDNH